MGGETGALSRLNLGRVLLSNNPKIQSGKGTRRPTVVWVAETGVAYPIRKRRRETYQPVAIVPIARMIRPHSWRHALTPPPGKENPGNRLANERSANQRSVDGRRLSQRFANDLAFDQRQGSTQMILDHHAMVDPEQMIHRRQ